MTAKSIDLTSNRSGSWPIRPTVPGANLNWLVKEKKIAPHIPVIDQSKRDDGTFSREDFAFDEERNVYICPAGKILTTTGRLVNDGETTLLYFASVLDCRSCPLKARCCPKMPLRRIPRSIYEEARDVARLSPKRGGSRNRAAIARRSRCYSHISSAFYGLTDCAFADRAEHSSSSRWRQSRDLADLQIWSHGRRRSHRLCALRKQRVPFVASGSIVSPTAPLRLAQNHGPGSSVKTSGRQPPFKPDFRKKSTRRVISLRREPIRSLLD